MAMQSGDMQINNKNNSLYNTMPKNTKRCELLEVNQNINFAFV